MATIERLGCSDNYEVAVHEQGGRSLWTRVAGVTALEWGRKLDDYSEAKVTVAKSKAGSACCGKLGRTRTWGHEISIYRDTRLVWQGPIVTKTETRSTFVFDCRDMLFWLDRRAINPNPSYRGQYFFPTPGVDTGALIALMIEDGFPRGDKLRDPGLTEWSNIQASGTKSTTDHLWANSTSVGGVVRDVIKSGVDLYTVGRTVTALPSAAANKLTPYRLTEDDFLAELQVQEDGMDAGTRGVLVGGEPVGADGNPINPPDNPAPPVIGTAGGPSAFFGQIDQISSSPNTTDVGIANSLARAMISYGNPPPMDIVIPQDAQLSPHAPISIHRLIPGRPIVVELINFCTPVAQRFRLNEVAVTWSDTEVERVQISLAGNGPPVGVGPVEGSTP